MVNKKYYYIKEYLSVYRFVMNCVVIALSCFIPLSAFSFAGARVNKYFNIGTVIVALFMLFLVLLILYKIRRNDRQSDFGIVQQYDFLYLFPNTKKQVIIPLGNIKQIRKKNNFRYNEPKRDSGKLIIVTEQGTHSLYIRAVNLIYKRLNKNLELYKEYEHLTESQIKEYVLTKEYVEVRAPSRNLLVFFILWIFAVVNLIFFLVICVKFNLTDTKQLTYFLICFAISSAYSAFAIWYMIWPPTAIEQKDDTLIIRPKRKERVVLSLADIEHVYIATMSGLPKKRLVVMTKNKKYVMTILNLNLTYNNLRYNLYAFSENIKMKQQGVNGKEPI